MKQLRYLARVVCFSVLVSAAATLACGPLSGFTHLVLLGLTALAVSED